MSRILVSKYSTMENMECALFEMEVREANPDVIEYSKNFQNTNFSFLAGLYNLFNTEGTWLWLSFFKLDDLFYWLSFKESHLRHRFEKDGVVTEECGRMYVFLQLLHVPLQLSPTVLEPRDYLKRNLSNEMLPCEKYCLGPTIII